MTEGGSGTMALIYCPCPDIAAAKRLGSELLDRRLAGCINLLPGMVSLYDWEGVREEAAEVVLIAKTRLDLADAARELLEAAHPYDVPAVLTLRLEAVNASYRDWLLEQMAGG